MKRSKPMMDKHTQEAGFARSLGLASATNIVIGSMIGSGIFIAPSLMAGYIRTPGLLVLLWSGRRRHHHPRRPVLAELAVRFSPSRRAVCVSCARPIRRLVGFLFGWTHVPGHPDRLHRRRGHRLRQVSGSLFPVPGRSHDNFFGPGVGQNGRVFVGPAGFDPGHRRR